MGSSVSRETGGLSFNPIVRGSRISLSNCYHQAERSDSFHSGLIFSSRPLLPQERIKIRVLKEEPRWHGALRLGITSVDPSTLDPALLPPFACPDLTLYPGFWAVGIPAELCQTGAVLSFWVDRCGRALFKREGDFLPKVLFSGIPKKTKLWVMLDVYGRTKAIQMIDFRRSKRESLCPCQSNKVPRSLCSGPNLASLEPTCSKMQSSSPKEPTSLKLRTETLNFRIFLEDEPNCIICQERLANILLLPCGHCSFCQTCVIQLKAAGACCPLCRQKILRVQNVGIISQIYKPALTAR
ncbi:E3 ubiquitin-protein ligase NEURL3 [Rhinophrynus dorsalis]